MKDKNFYSRSARSLKFWVLQRLHDYCKSCHRNPVKTFEWQSFEKGLLKTSMNQSLFYYYYQRFNFSVSLQYVDFDIFLNYYYHVQIIFSFLSFFYCLLFWFNFNLELTSISFARQKCNYSGLILILIDSTFNVTPGYESLNHYSLYFL